MQETTTQDTATPQANSPIPLLRRWSRSQIRGWRKLSGVSKHTRKVVSEDSRFKQVSMTKQSPWRKRELQRAKNKRQRAARKKNR